MPPRNRKRSDATNPGGESADGRATSPGKDEPKSSKRDAGQVDVHPDVYNGDTRIEIDGQTVDLKNRYLAALLAWLVPGAGHYYQGRQTKATLFLVSILSIWVLGFSLGGGHVVYASWTPGDKRWHYFLQAGVGAAALPALMQNRHLNQSTDPRTGQTRPSYKPKWGGLMAPPQRPVIESEPDEVAAWYARRGSGYELGTWYTMIAGLLNLLVVYDAYGGPLSVPISGRRKSDSAPAPASP